MDKMTRVTVIATFWVVTALIASWPAPSGMADVTTPDTGCATFCDWIYFGTELEPNWHQHHSGPYPWIQRGETEEWDWFTVHVLDADGKQHPNLTPDWTLSYAEAHHESCDFH